MDCFGLAQPVCDACHIQAFEMSSKIDFADVSITPDLESRRKMRDNSPFWLLRFGCNGSTTSRLAS
jgi:hypothetical protein